MRTVVLCLLLLLACDATILVAQESKTGESGKRIIEDFDPQNKKIIDPGKNTGRICQVTLEAYESRSCDTKCTADCKQLVSRLSSCNFVRKYTCSN